MSQITKNQVVSIIYEVKDADTQEIVDSNTQGKPLEFLVGAGQIISGLEKSILESKKGDKLNVSIPPEEAYGIYQSDYLQEVPRDQFEGITLEAGMTLFGQAENGQTIQVVVKDFNESNVIIDYNHPLAGKTLLFDVEITDVRDATFDEILQGGVGGGCGCGGCGCAGESEESKDACHSHDNNHSCGCHH